jgi:hypothetical protein
VNIQAPAAFSTGVLNSILYTGRLAKLPDCGVSGAGTWNLLLGFDIAANTLTVASAQVDADTAVNENVNGIQVSPATTDAAIEADGSFTTSSTFSSNQVIYGDGAGAVLMVLPLRETVVSGTLSFSRACIGSYNADTLASNACAADEDHPAFTDAGRMEAFIALEDADAVFIADVQQSLCVLLGGTSDGGSPKKCARDSMGRIESFGDWCSATNQAADAGCADAVRFSATFAARAVPG